jgi:hypothetical protein
LRDCRFGVRSAAMPQRLLQKFMISTSENLTDDEIRKPVLKKLKEDDLLAIVAYLASLVP